MLYPENIDDSRINYFIDQLVDGFDSYYWNKEWVAYTNTGEKETVKTRLNDLIIAMTNAPEFQLM